ncbi:hypothetical protein [Frigidibacter sp. ROC022]|uniref:hypothetical protein n=1 Tax=Frigidibacter sp. ROC022 TaxID=2971796 RepID=UPI00215A35CF|nr:hypothetical protein [Frigidibacter sp. ROC022]MCR8724299.1 hypothetical protein [Frigidibacter sp. ROC022]
MRYVIKRGVLIAILGFGSLLAFVAWRDADLSSALVIGGATLVAALAVSFWIGPSQRRSRGFEPRRRHRW